MSGAPLDGGLRDALNESLTIMFSHSKFLICRDYPIALHRVERKAMAELIACNTLFTVYNHSC